MTTASPPASVRVPAASSSSSSRKSDAANRPCSSSDFNSAPSKDEAPAITIRIDFRSRDMGSRGSRDEAMPQQAHDVQGHAGSSIPCGEEKQNLLGPSPHCGAE